MRRLILPARFSILLVPTMIGLACGEDSAGVATTVGGTTTGVDSTTGFDETTTGFDSSTSGDPTLGESSTGPVGPPTCDDSIVNGEETDVDCGGPDCDPCPAGGECDADEDCDEGICDNGECQSPTCYDGHQNGMEEGVDCGGPCPNACETQGCETDFDCDDGFFCSRGECVPAACDNGIIDTHETDLDCGGGDCPPCADGLMCNNDDDCISGICDPMTFTCVPATCEDGTQNGDETDIDCGGSCDPCPNGSDCMDGNDCVNLVCDNGTCVAPTCMDMVQNGDETDEDCGGSCPDCPNGGTCVDNDDCESGSCSMGLCVPASCMDMVQNGDETDEDCGNSCGPTCEENEECDDGADCIEGVCEFGLCSAPDCNDMVQNGDETDEDCGNGCGATCEPTEGCDDDADCVEGVCDLNSMTCAMPMCDDMVQNGDETDEDCGNSCGATCEPTEGCDDGADCTTGVCYQSLCQDATCDDDVQNGDEGGIDCQGSCPQPCTPDGETQVNTYANDFQTHPAITSGPAGNYFAVVWTSTPGQDSSGAGVFAKVYDANANPVGGEIQVNTTTAGDQQFPAIDANDSGFVVVWEGPDADGTGIFGQRYDAAGNPVANEFPVNTTTAGVQRRPSVAIEDGGSFVICWEGEVVTREILCQRYTAAGAAAGAETQVNTTTLGNQQVPVVEMNDAGEYTVVWQSSNDHDGDGIGIFLRRFDASGGSLSAETQVNAYVTSDQSGPSIGMNGAGAFVIAWTSGGQDGSVLGVYARRYNANGTAAGGEFQVNTYTTLGQSNPSVALNGTGDFVVVWQSANQDGNLTGVFGQRFNDVGAAIGVEFLVNTTTIGLQEDPDITIRGADEPIVVWGDGDSNFTNRNVMMQRFIGEL